MIRERNPFSPWWTAQRSGGRVIATAIHDGNGLRDEVRQAMALADPDRLREEDPFTGQAIAGVPDHVIAGRSRFEVDLNRSPETALYRTPEQSWGLEVWKKTPDPGLIARSLEIHAAYYAMMEQWLADVEAGHDRFVVLDVHSYNHRRSGPEAAPTPQDDAPDINIGTFSMPREHWAWLLDPLMDAMRDFDFGGRRLDVRENVAFQGKGEQTRFVHERFPETGCAIAIEFKKFFMDEWSGAPDPVELKLMRDFMTHVAETARAMLDAG
jgi:hypothetical protein